MANVEDPALVAYGFRMDSSAGDDRIVKDTAHAGVIDSNLWYPGARVRLSGDG